jgi:hypothetical protein
MEVNGQLYRRCPRATSLENFSARFLVNLYFDCRKRNCYPRPGGPLEQTAFTMDLFDYLDGLIAEAERKSQEAEYAKAKASTRSKK